MMSAQLGACGAVHFLNSFRLRSDGFGIVIPPVVKGLFGWRLRQSSLTSGAGFGLDWSIVGKLLNVILVVSSGVKLLLNEMFAKDLESPNVLLGGILGENDMQSSLVSFCTKEITSFYFFFFFFNKYKRTQQQTNANP